MTINPGQDWTRLGQWLADERAAHNLDRAAAAKAAGIHYKTLYNYEMGRTRAVTDEMRKIARLYGWAPGSIEAVLGGGTPTYLVDLGDRTALAVKLADSNSALTHRDRAILRDILIGRSGDA